MKKLLDAVAGTYHIIKATSPAFIVWILGFIVNQEWYMCFTFILGIILFIYGIYYAEKDEIKFIKKTMKELNK